MAGIMILAVNITGEHSATLVSSRRCILFSSLSLARSSIRSSSNDRSPDRGELERDLRSVHTLRLRFVLLQQIKVLLYNLFSIRSTKFDASYCSAFESLSSFLTPSRSVVGKPLILDGRLTRLLNRSRAVVTSSDI